MSEQMDNLTDSLKKAFYLGVGLASYATEQISDIQAKAQEAADDLIRRGETTSEEATRLMNTWMPQNQTADSDNIDRPQKIEILSVEDVDPDSNPDA
jgi:polyhydroxyalkanoate synthesis regulator phasin